MSNNKPLRVGYVLKRYPRYSETFIVNEILAHEASGMELEIYSLRPPLEAHFQDRIARVRAPVNFLVGEGVKASALWKSIAKASDVLPGLWARLESARDENAADLFQAIELARRAKLAGIEHLHAHFATVATTVARLAARFAGISYSFTAHAKDIFHESVEHDLLRQKLSDAATVVTVSDFNVMFLRENFNSAAHGVCRIYNGLDLNDFSYQTPKQRPPEILAVGRLVEKKGFADLIDACAILARRGRKFRCRIIGAGELQANLNARIERLGLEAWVEMSGPRPQAEVIDLVQQSALLAAPCVVGEDGNRDGLPTVLLEAMALGTPAVSSDVTGIPEILRHEKTGLMVPQNEPAVLADSMERLLDDSALRVRLAENARRLIEAEFDIHQNASRLRDVFRKAVCKDEEAEREHLQEVR